MPSLDTPVRTDLFVAGSNLLAATLLLPAATTVDWWLVPPTALVTAALTAAADRRRLGLYLLYLAAIPLVLGVAWVAVTDGAPLGAFGAFPPMILGLGLGTAANRLLFGVIRPVPALRRERAD
ncbi:MAG: hypothetical protein ABEH58_03530 [Haloplanus sp.]